MKKLYGTILLFLAAAMALMLLDGANFNSFGLGLFLAFGLGGMALICS